MGSSSSRSSTSGSSSSRSSTSGSSSSRSSISESSSSRSSTSESSSSRSSTSESSFSRSSTSGSSSSEDEDGARGEEPLRCEVCNDQSFFTDYPCVPLVNYNCDHAVCRTCWSEAYARKCKRCPFCHPGDFEEDSSGEQTFPIVLKDITGRKYRLEVTEEMLVRDVKVLLCTKGGYDSSPGEIRLLFAGRQLDDGRTLTSYGIVQGNIGVLHIIMRLRGGDYWGKKLLQLVTRGYGSLLPARSSLVMENIPHSGATLESAKSQVEEQMNVDHLSTRGPITCPLCGACSTFVIN